MNKITDKKQVRNTTILFMLIYFVSYITRINYGAVISAMLEAEPITKAQASLAVTGSFITYGAGQLVSGTLGDKIQPKILVLCGLLTTTLMNLLIPCCNANAYLMLGVWCINGFAQAFMWPPLVKLMTALFNEKDYKKACMIVSWGSSFGTIAVYLAAPVLISLFNWKAIFIFSAAAGIIMAAVWQKKAVFIELKAVESRNGENGETLKPTPAFIGVIAVVMLVIILQGSLRDGVTTWMPSYISETFNLSSSVSILSGVILPLFSILTYQLASWLYNSKLKNELVCAGSIFCAGAASAILMSLFSGKSAVISVVLSAVLTGCMHGVNFVLICMIPPYFKKYGKVSFASGLFNSCTYIGSAISTYGIAVFSESFGWESTIVLWAVIASVGTALCFLMSKKWKKTISQ